MKDIEQQAKTEYPFPTDAGFLDKLEKRKERAAFVKGYEKARLMGFEERKLFKRKRIMGQYRLAFYLRFQIGFLIAYDKDLQMIGIDLPLFALTIATSKDAHGIRFFKD